MSKKKKTIEVVLPEVSVGDVESGLYTLTETISINTDARLSGGMLGGEFGYGADYENEVFMMHPFCWCEEGDCGWCAGIGAMPQLLREVGNVKYSESERLPNFLYKPTNTRVWWYKYIGRGMEQKGTLPKDWLKKCQESIEHDK